MDLIKEILKFLFKVREFCFSCYSVVLIMSIVVDDDRFKRFNEYCFTESNYNKDLSVNWLLFI